MEINYCGRINIKQVISNFALVALTTKIQTKQPAGGWIQMFGIIVYQQNYLLLQKMAYNLALNNQLIIIVNKHICSYGCKYLEP